MKSRCVGCKAECEDRDSLTLDEKIEVVVTDCSNFTKEKKNDTVGRKQRQPSEHKDT